MTPAWSPATWKCWQPFCGPMCSTHLVVRGAMHAIIQATFCFTLTQLVVQGQHCDSVCWLALQSGRRSWWLEEWKLWKILDAQRSAILIFWCKRPLHVCPIACTPADVSHQAYCLLRGYLQRFPYARLERHDGGPYAGRPFVVFDTAAAWQPLAALRWASKGRAAAAHGLVTEWPLPRLQHRAAGLKTAEGQLSVPEMEPALSPHLCPSLLPMILSCSNRQGFTKRYLFEEAIKVGSWMA